VIVRIPRPSRAHAVLAARFLVAYPGDPTNATPVAVAASVVIWGAGRLASGSRRPAALVAGAVALSAVTAAVVVLLTANPSAALWAGVALHVLRALPALAALVRQGRSATCGCHMGSMSARRGFFWSRADRTGSVTPQSAPTAGSSQATPSSSAGL
jgi:hypothetical protein